MKEHLAINRTIRNNFFKVISALSNEQLVKIPEGFNNNILWNFGHIIATQNILCYKLSGLPFSIDEDIIERYRKGTKPGSIDNVTTEKELLIDLAQASSDQLEKDLGMGIFKTFTPYETSFGRKLNSIEDAVVFNNVHEGMHLGVIMSLRKLG
ncbi:DinB family protein [Marivirga atlantica]|uniref:DinB family protein n=1 Tax=Marivirga atlantica TaxID=1548457 RepID=A0A937DL77_9BACT|nr:DinB family protein [Marivirga atlantica]MBL0766986.1 DinB family protein [Marivirga atlantica]